jgi:hypothetical protein
MKVSLCLIKQCFGMEMDERVEILGQYFSPSVGTV